MTEQLEEKWFKFRRIHFVEGHIDVVMMDSINNPNNEKKHQMQLNSMASFYRCNGSEWASGHELFRIHEHLLMTDLTAKMIWDNCYHEYQELLKNPK